MNVRYPGKSRGAVLIEFAIVIVMVIFLVFGLLELGRAFYSWNSAVDAVHRGARAAAIAAVDDREPVVNEMRRAFPALADENITIQYSSDGATWGDGCGAAPCQYVRVQVSYTLHTLVWFLPATIPMPGFAATSVVEALGET